MIVDSLSRMASTVNVFRWSSESSLNCNGDIDDVRGKAYKYIEKHQWENLRKLLNCVDLSDLGLTYVDKNGRNLLHTVCSNEPPLDVVKRIVIVMPAMLDATDWFNRSPLHEAVRHDASPEVAKFLVESMPECAMIRDADGRTPLMLACCQMGQFEGDRPYFASALHRRIEEERWLLHMCRLGHELAVSYPPSILAKDRYGMTALEHALESEAPRQTIRTLQHLTSRMTRKVHKAMDIKRRREMASRQKVLESEESRYGPLGATNVAIVAATA